MDRQPEPIVNDGDKMSTVSHGRRAWSDKPPSNIYSKRCNTLHKHPQACHITTCIECGRSI